MNQKIENRENSKIRYPFVDLIRGIAVVLMIYFHFFYDLNQFKYVEIDFFREPFWFYLPRLIVTLFLFAVGLSLTITHSRHFAMRPYLRRLAKIGVGAAAISISTYFMFPKNWVYFGTLHCIFFCTLLCTPLINKKMLALIFSIIIFSLEFSGYGIPFWSLPHPSMDYIPVFPWVAVSFLGLFAHKLKIHEIKTPQNIVTRPILLLGRNAFVIYIIHQPIMFGLISLYSKLTA